MNCGSAPSNWDLNSSSLECIYTTSTAYITSGNQLDFTLDINSGSNGGLYTWLVQTTDIFTVVHPTNVNTYVDGNAPTTTDNVPSNWNTSDVTVTFTCDDGIGVGCDVVYYTIDGNAPTTASSFVNEEGDWEFTISSDGEYTIKYSGEDKLENLETVKTASNILKLDKTKPTTSGSITSGTLGTNGWYTTDVNYTITPVDSISNVYFTEYCLSDTNNCTPDTNYSSPTLLSVEGNNYIRFRTIDNAGNVQEIQESGLIKIDKTKPLLSTWTNTLNVNEDIITIEAIDNLMFNQPFINNVLLFTINDVNKIEDINFSLSDQNFLSIKYTQTFIPGDYNISIKVRDEAGNEMTYAHNYTLNVAYVYSFSFPTGDVFKTNLERGKFFKSQFEKIPSWDENYMLSDLLTSNEGPLSERSEISYFNTVYFYNSTDGWTTVDSNMFTTYNLFNNLRNENYMYFDIVGADVPEKAIRHSLGLVN